MRGSCLCGGVRYRIQGPLFDARNCHCSMCRKAQGSAFRTRASVRAADFAWEQGEDLVTFYESSPGNRRGFCRVCGSPLPVALEGTNFVVLPAGGLDGNIETRPFRHIFVSQNPSWHSITDTMPQFEQRPPVGQRLPRSTNG